jgi:dipeptidyl aminopeptidase/acylaminoacyl peptidase
MTRSTWIVLVTLAAPSVPCVAADPLPPQIEDLYRTDVAVGAITIRDGQSVIYVRQRVDPQTRTVKQSLWRVDAGNEPRPVETGEPDASSPMLSPDGKGIVFLSTRPFDDGTSAALPVPAYSDPAVDIWFLPLDGSRAIPLGGKGKPYGRVITDSFYGRVSFSPDGKRLLFVADDGRDRRTEQERRNNVIVVRDDQGEGYEAYGPTQVWVADLLDEPNVKAAGRVTRLTPDD